MAAVKTTTWNGANTGIHSGRKPAAPPPPPTAQHVNGMVRRSPEPVILVPNKLTK
jgi:hypothetical protein